MVSVFQRRLGSSCPVPAWCNGVRSVVVHLVTQVVAVQAFQALRFHVPSTSLSTMVSVSLELGSHTSGGWSWWSFVLVVLASIWFAAWSAWPAELREMAITIYYRALYGRFMLYLYIRRIGARFSQQPDDFEVVEEETDDEPYAILPLACPHPRLTTVGSNKSYKRYSCKQCHRFLYRVPQAANAILDVPAVLAPVLPMILAGGGDDDEDDE